MRILLIAVLAIAAAGAAAAQDRSVQFVVTESAGRAFVISPTTPLAATTPGDTQADRSRPLHAGGSDSSSPGVSPSGSGAGAASRGWYVAVFTSQYCGPCGRMKDSVIPALKRAGVKVAVVDTDSADYKPGWKVSLVPETWIIDRGAPEPRARLVGYRTAQAILTAGGEYRPADTGHSPEVAGPTLFGRVGTSHESRETLIEHLLSDGIHARRHSLQDLQWLTDQQLVDLHDREHQQAGHVVQNNSWKPPPAQNTQRVISPGRWRLFRR